MFHLLLAIIYLSFISLGLPDALLGAAWPVMYPELGVPVSGAGFLSAIIAGSTILSSLMSSKLSQRLNPGSVTAFSVCLTAAALLGFSRSSTITELALWAIPYGLGAGSVDAGLNNYVALHYTSRHMSWLHCMWSIGAASGPQIMGILLTGGHHWTLGYRIIGIAQIFLTAVLFLSLPLWKKTDTAETGTRSKSGFRQALSVPGSAEGIAAFFLYCALETSAGLWAGAYLVLRRGADPEIAAFFSAMFFIGITLGRAVNGFLTVRFSDTQLIRGGFALAGAGICITMLASGIPLCLMGFCLIGLGCAPIFPCMIHATPVLLGQEHSHTQISMQIASAYLGTLAAPALFGWAAGEAHMGALPVYLALLLGIMILNHFRLLQKAQAA